MSPFEGTSVVFVEVWESGQIDWPLSHTNFSNLLHAGSLLLWAFHLLGIRIVARDDFKWTMGLLNLLVHGFIGHNFRCRGW